MKKTFGHRVIVIGLIVSLVASPAWAGISATISVPASGSSRSKIATVPGGGTITLTNGDHIDNWTWMFGFGTKSPAGAWNPELEQDISTQTATNWAHTLNAPPWNVSPTMQPPNPPMPMPDHFARVTFIYIADPNVKNIFETNMHTVTN